MSRIEATASRVFDRGMQVVQAKEEVRHMCRGERGCTERSAGARSIAMDVRSRPEREERKEEQERERVKK